MRDIDGVVFLRSEPAGLSLTSELREELRACTSGSLPTGALAQHPAVGDTIYKLLGVPPNTSLEEIEAAYQKWIWQSRHEKPAPRGYESEKETEQQMRAVKAAYEAFLQARKPKQTEEVASNMEQVWEQFRRSER